MEKTIQAWLFDPVVGRLLTTVVTILMTILVVRWAKSYAGKKIKDSNIRYRTRKLINFMGYIAAGFVLTLVFSDKLGGLTIAFGVAGAGIAFALQEVIASVAGWFVINFARFFKTGERVQLGGITGDVIDVGLLRTTLMEVGAWVNGDLYNGRVVRITNSFVFKDPVYNYSGDFPFLWDEIEIPVKSDSDYRDAHQILTDVADEIVGDYSAQAAVSWQGLVEKFRIENAAVEPMITMVFDENWITFTLRYVVDYKKRRSTKHALFTRILEEIEKTEERVMVAAGSIEISEFPGLDVKIIEKR